MTNREIIDSVIVNCSTILGVSAFSLETVLLERENIGFCDKYLYDTSAGLLLQLGINSSDDSTYSGGNISEAYLDERKIILQYALSIKEEEVVSNRKKSLDSVIKMLKTTKNTFNREFLNLLHLLILFDYDEMYSNLCSPIAEHIIKSLYEEFKSNGRIPVT